MILDLPPPPQIWLPPKPAIIRPAPDVKPLLAMPLTMGMLCTRRAITGSFAGSDFSSGSATTYNLGPITVSNPTSDRMIVAIITGDQSAARNVNSCTVGGVSLTKIVARESATGGGNQVAGIFAEFVTTGTSLSCSVTFSGSMLNCGIGLFAVYGKTSVTAQETANGNTSGSLTMAVGDYVICVSCDGAGTLNTATNFTERVDVAIGGATLQGGDYLSTATGSRTFSVTGTDSFACASWRP